MVSIFSFNPQQRQQVKSNYSFNIGIFIIAAFKYTSSLSHCCPLGCSKFCWGGYKFSQCLEQTEHRNRQFRTNSWCKNSLTFLKIFWYLFPIMKPCHCWNPSPLTWVQADHSCCSGEGGNYKPLTATFWASRGWTFDTQMTLKWFYAEYHLKGKPWHPTDSGRAEQKYPTEKAGLTWLIFYGITWWERDDVREGERE